MRLKEFLNEKVSKKEQEDALNNKNIWIGMEFEFKLDGVEGGLPPGVETEYENALYDYEAVKKAIDEWEEELRVLDSNIEDIMDKMNNEEDEDKIEALEREKQELEDEQDRLREDPSYYDIDLSDYFRYMSNYEGIADYVVIDENFPRPTHPNDLGIGNNLEDFFQWRDAVEDIVEDIVSNASFIKRYELNDYGETKQEKGSNLWGFEYDSTVSPDGGIEMVSPPMKLPEMIKILPDIFDIIAKYGYTDSDCGLHAHMSVKNGELDLTKLIFFVEEENIYKYFPERVDSGYAGSLKNKIRTADAENISVELKKGLRKIPKKTDLVKTLAKYDAIHHIEGNRVEFRHLGDKHYHRKFNDIKNILARHSFALSVAVDPEWRKQEYIKRIVRVLNKIERGILEYKITTLNWFITSIEKNYIGGYFDRTIFPWSLSQWWDRFTPEIKAKIKKIFEKELKQVKREIKQTGVKFDSIFYGAPSEDITITWERIYKDINLLYNKNKEFNKLASR